MGRWLSFVETSMRPRKHNRNLPPCVYHRHGAYYHVKAGKWTRLAVDLPTALTEYARLHNQPKGGMAALIEEALPHILKGKADATIAQYKVAARRLQEILAEFAPTQVTPRHIAQIRRSMASTYSVANRTIGVLRMVFDYALEEQLVESNPCVGIKRFAQHTRTRRILPGEYQAIRAKAKPLLQVIMDLCYLTGQRIGDVLTIKRADLQADGIYIEQQKTGARLMVAWTPELHAAVDQAKALHGGVAGMTYLLKGLGNKAPTYHMIWKQWTKACQAAKVEDANIHDLRAMSGTDAEAQGHDPQALLGHTDRKMTQRYLRDRIVPVVEGPSFGQTPRVLDGTK
jgi:integrase